MSFTSKYRALKRVINSKSLPDFIYRMDERGVATVRQLGLQPKGNRTDGIFGQVAIDPMVSVIEHVNKAYDAGGSCNLADPYISCFDWKALQPINAATLAFMQGYANGYVYMIDTATVTAAGRQLYYANEVFDRAERASQYRGQREWSCYGVIPASAIRFMITVPYLMTQLAAGNNAPNPMTLTWQGV